MNRYQVAEKAFTNVLRKYGYCGEAPDLSVIDETASDKAKAHSNSFIANLFWNNSEEDIDPIEWSMNLIEIDPDSFELRSSLSNATHWASHLFNTQVYASLVVLNIKEKSAELLFTYTMTWGESEISKPLLLIRGLIDNGEVEIDTRASRMVDFEGSHNF